ncbi:GNAT family N-acetyltransferase [Streptomyces sp. NPDC090127]|uniref:GNAT family N-acetyltransferase n=1 Tax=Streptomyces sp. NPDC090127 TaxID=3365953 RepID=UPI0038247C75
MTTIQADPIRTPRLALLPLAVEHAEEMAGVLGDPALYVFIGDEPPTVAALRARYERQTAGAPGPGVSWCHWVVRETDAGCLVGTVQATVRHDDASAEVAWVVGTPRQDGEVLWRLTVA